MLSSRLKKSKNESENEGLAKPLLHFVAGKPLKAKSIHKSSTYHKKTPTNNHGNFQNIFLQTESVYLAKFHHDNSIKSLYIYTGQIQQTIKIKMVQQIWSCFTVLQRTEKKEEKKPV